MPASVPQAVQSCHEPLLWLIPQLDKFPRVRRFTLGECIEGGLLEVLELLVEAAYSRNKEAPLRRAAPSPQPSIRWCWPSAKSIGSISVGSSENH
jgi:hypothetical protein